jgi:hypothetical protein
MCLFTAYVKALIKAIKYQYVRENIEFRIQYYTLLKMRFELRPMSL